MLNSIFLKNLYSRKITVLNKIDGKDNDTGVDIWKKTEVNDVEIKRVENRVFSGKEVYTSFDYEVMFSNIENYVAYKDLVQNTSYIDTFTLRTGDYIVFSTFDEEVTSKNITSILKDFEDDVIKVKNVYKPKETAFTNVKLVAKGSW